MLAVAVPKRNKLQNIIVLTPKDGACKAHNSRKAQPVGALYAGIAGSETGVLFLPVHDKIPSIINSSDK